MTNFTQEEFDTLKKAYASGSLTVKHGDKLITYRSLNEMKKLLDAMSRDVNNTQKSEFGKMITPSWDS